MGKSGYPIRETNGMTSDFPIRGSESENASWLEELRRHTISDIRQLLAADMGTGVKEKDTYHTVVFKKDKRVMNIRIAKDRDVLTNADNVFGRTLLWNRRRPNTWSQQRVLENRFTSKREGRNG